MTSDLLVLLFLMAALLAIDVLALRFGPDNRHGPDDWRMNSHAT